MGTETKRIRIEPGSELARLLDEAGDTPVLLEKNGEMYRLTRAGADIWTGYDPAKVRTALAKTAGSWADIDTDKLITDLYRAREEGSRPITRP